MNWNYQSFTALSFWINNLSIAGESKASAVYYITFYVLELFITDLP